MKPRDASFVNFKMLYNFIPLVNVCFFGYHLDKVKYKIPYRKENIYQNKFGSVVFVLLSSPRQPFHCSPPLVEKIKVMSENAILFAALLSTFVYIASALGRLECFIRKRDPAIPFILYSILQLLTAPIALVFWYFFMKH